MRELSPKELRFIELYLNSDNIATYCNATESYCQAYQLNNRNLAGVKGSLLLRKGRVKRYKEEVMSEFKIDVSKHLRTLDKKLDSLTEEGKISKEELMAIRLLAETEGKIGSKSNIQAVQIQVGSNGQINLETMGLFTLLELQKKIEEQLENKLKSLNMNKTEGAEQTS
jgi:hypothetical protein